jgi:hypothetical protein
MLGITYQHTNEKETAINCFERAVAVNPKDAWAAELLAAAKPAPIKIEEPAPVIEKTEETKQMEERVDLPASPIEEPAKETPSEAVPHMDQR